MLNIFQITPFLCLEIVETSYSKGIKKMANIGATTAFYKVETSLTRANSEVSKSMERLATGRQNANAGDRSSYVAMADTFRLDYVGTKAGIKSASVVMGYLETGLRVIDSASGLVSRLQELAVLGANNTNTTADAAAIDAEFVAIAEELNRLLETATYKGKSLFNTEGAFKDKVALGGRGAEMSFGMGNVTIKNSFKNLYVNETYIRHAGADTTLSTQNAYLIQEATGTGNTDLPAVNLTWSDLSDALDGSLTGTTIGQTIDTTTAVGTALTTLTLDELKTAGVAGVQYKPSDAFTGSNTTATVTGVLEALQNDLNTARVEAGSQYAAIESALNYTTDLTAQYELGYNTVNDVNFSMETAHLAKNQILQQAATSMLSQANQGQQGLLQLIQG